MQSKVWQTLDEEFMTDAAEAWEEANQIDDSFIKDLTGYEMVRAGAVPVLPSSFDSSSGVYSSILKKFIDPITGYPIEE